MFVRHIGSWFRGSLPIFLSPPDAGSGAGSGAAAGASPASSGAAAGSASGGNTTSASGSAGASSAPFRLSDDSIVDLGDGTPMRWADVVGERGRYMPREKYDQAAQLLIREAERVDAHLRNVNRGRGNREDAGRQQQDRYAHLRGQPIVDGDTIASLAERLEREGFGQISQVLSGVAQKVQSLEAQLGKVGGVASNFQQQQAEREFESRIDEAFTNAQKLGPIKGVPDGITLDSTDPFLRELAKDVYLSHDQNSWQKGEFERSLRTRIESGIAFVKSLQAAAVKKAKEDKQHFFDPKRGNGRATGENYRYERGSDLAARMFDSIQSPT